MFDFDDYTRKESLAELLQWLLLLVLLVGILGGGLWLASRIRVASGCRQLPNTPCQDANQIRAQQ
jgi:hypothetical protein